MTVRAVLFDVNETLSSLEPLRDRLEAVGLGREAFEPWFAAVLRDGMAAAAADELAMFPEIARHHLERLGRRAGLEDPAAAADQVLGGFEAVTAHGDVAPALERLGHAGVRTATLTNGTAAITRSFLDREGLSELVGAVLEVADAGVWKPDPRAYRYAADRIGVPLGELALVAVHPWDVQGARHAGAVAAWVNRDGDRYPTFFATPDVQGASLVEVVEALLAR